MLERHALQEATGLIGESEPMREVMVKVEQMAPVSSTVLIEGESGTGKELVARALRALSPRRNKPFIAVNVGALPETLLESELFGHEKGAFTGAAERRLGRFELADGGTIFLDEIGEIPPSTQVKLLRVLEEREFTRVGGTRAIKVDVRVIAATNRPLREHVEDGKLPRRPVLSAERPEHLSAAAARAARATSRCSCAGSSRISRRSTTGRSTASRPTAMQLLVEYPWPGNVRELRNLVESMVVLSPGSEIEPTDIPRQIREGGAARLLPVHVGPVVRGSGGRRRAGAGVHRAQPAGAQAAGRGAAPSPG